MTGLEDKRSSLCISHKEDVDGIASAILIKNLFSPKSIMLVDYGNMINELQKVSDSFTSSEDKRFERIFICDLALSKKNEREFAAIILKIRSRGVMVTYVDHHDVSAEIISELKASGTKVIRDIEECTTVQIYSAHEAQMDSHSAFYAAAASLTDYMDGKPAASKLVNKFDRQFLMLESTALSYIISANQHDDAFLVSLVNTLAEKKYPHDLDKGFEIAQQYARMVGDAAKRIEANMTRLDNLAYASSDSALSTSMVVNFVLGLSGKPVAVIYKSRSDMVGKCQVSVRGSDECKVHLGRLVNEIASQLGGNGGGHEKACGAIIPENAVPQFVQTLDGRVKK